MEILCCRELLPDECAADDRAVAPHERAVCLRRERDPCDRGDDPRIDQSRNDDHRRRDDDGGAHVRTNGLARHGQTSLRKTRARSMILMPTNGTTMPPKP